MRPTTLPVRLADPQRTIAVLSVRSDINDLLLEQFNVELARWIEHDELITTGSNETTLALRDARDKLSAAIQRIDVLATLGPPSTRCSAKPRE